jgi:hypothetical protein
MATFIYKIPPTLPLPKGGRIPLFGKWFDETHHPEFAEGEGRACLPDRQGEIFIMMSVQ